MTHAPIEDRHTRTAEKFFCWSENAERNPAGSEVPELAQLLADLEARSHRAGGREALEVAAAQIKADSATALDAGELPGFNHCEGICRRIAATYAEPEAGDD